jgi:integrase
MTCATLLYEQGVPIENIQDVLGHSSPTITRPSTSRPHGRSSAARVDRLGFLFGSEA